MKITASAIIVFLSTFHCLGNANGQQESGTTTKLRGNTSHQNHNRHDSTKDGLLFRRRTQQHLGDGEICSTSDECYNGCCSNFYSKDGLSRCTLFAKRLRSEFCVVSNNGGGNEVNGPEVNGLFDGDDDVFGGIFNDDGVIGGIFNDDDGAENDDGGFGNGDDSDGNDDDAGSGLPTGGNGGQYGLQPDCFQDDGSRFNICLDLASVDGTYKPWMDGALFARDRWQSVIVGDTFPAGDTQSLSGQDIEIATNLPPIIDDIYIAVFERDIDGSGRILGSAIPTLIATNDAGQVLPVAGHFMLDVADIASLEADNSVQGVIEHEMGHVLGFGTLFSRNGLHSGRQFDSQYNGLNALQAWRDMGCSGDIPIETDGGPGTAGGHWDEACLQGELMTGFATGSSLSRLTIGAMMDLGYSVDVNAADPFSLDQLSASGCGSFCPEATGTFSFQSVSTSSTTGGTNWATMVRSKISEERDMHAIMTVAATMMQKYRANRPLSVPEGYQYVGGDFMSVLTKDSNGKIQETTVTWEDVQEFFKGQTSP